MKKVLLLNEGDEILCILPMKRALHHLAVDKIDIVETYESDGLPSVVRMKYYVNLHKPDRKRTNYSKHGIWLRDRKCCQYCGMELSFRKMTVDHVMPRSRGGLGKWDNIVTACKKCNTLKANRTPEEAKMKLLNVPRKPTEDDIKSVTVYVTKRMNLSKTIKSVPDEKWEKYIDWEVALCQ